MGLAALSLRIQFFGGDLRFLEGIKWAAIVAAMLVPAAIQAAPVVVEVTAQPFRQPGKPGLQTRALVVAEGGSQAFKSTRFPLSFDTLDKRTVTLFALVTYDLPYEDDDLVPQVISVTFDFGPQVGIYMIKGRSTGVINGDAQYAVAWFPEAEVMLDDDTRIRVQIETTVFGINSDGALRDGRDGAGFVKATFSRTSPE